MDVLIDQSEIRRDLTDLTAFSNLTTVPFLGINEGGTALMFDGDLTQAEIDAVLHRAMTEPNEEVIRAKMASAMQTLQTFIDLPTPTQAQVVAQVRAQARILRAILRYIQRDFTGSD